MSTVTTRQVIYVVGSIPTDVLDRIVRSDARLTLAQITDEKIVMMSGRQAGKSFAAALMRQAEKITEADYTRMHTGKERAQWKRETSRRR